MRIAQRGRESRAKLDELLGGRKARLEASDIGAPSLDEDAWTRDAADESGKPVRSEPQANEPVPSPLSTERPAAPLGEEKTIIEAAAKIVQGEVYRGRYRTWPWWGDGNRATDSELVQFSDAAADQIRALSQGTNADVMGAHDREGILMARALLTRRDEVVEECERVARQVGCQFCSGDGYVMGGPAAIVATICAALRALKSPPRDREGGG